MPSIPPTPPARRIFPYLVGGLILFALGTAASTASAQEGSFRFIETQGGNNFALFRHDGTSFKPVFYQDGKTPIILPRNEVNRGVAAIGASSGKDSRGAEIINVPADKLQRFLDAAKTEPGATGPSTIFRVDQLKVGSSSWLSIFEPLGNILLVLVDYILTIIMWVLGLFLSLAGMFTDFMLSAKTLAGAPIVKEMWQVTRDSLNFVFILALLAIAFSTIANIEDYGMRRLLPRLIIAALLVNFSLAISGAFLQGANVLAKEAASDRYLPKQACPDKTGASGGIGTSITCALANSASIKQFYEFSPSKFTNAFGVEARAPAPTGGGTLPLNRVSVTGDFTENVGKVVGAASAVVFVALFASALITLAAMLGVRIAVLLLLLILSPVPYVFSVVPRASDWAGKWWSTFIQYTVFLPAIVFFLVLAIRLADVAGLGAGAATGSTGDSIAKQLGMETARLGVTNKEQQQIILNAFSAFLVSAFIFVSIFVAKALGIYGADAAIKFGRRAVGGAALGTALVSGRVGREVGKGAAYGTLKAGESKGWVGTGLQTIGRPIGAAARAVTAPASYARRVLTGETVDQQIDRQKKSISQMGATGISALARTGNLGAQSLALDRGYIKTPTDFKRIYGSAPAGSKHQEEVIKNFRERFPVTGTRATKQVGENVTEEIGKSWSRLREGEKLGKALGDKEEGPQILRLIKGENLKSDEKPLPVFSASQVDALLEQEDGAAALQGALKKATLRRGAQARFKRLQKEAGVEEEREEPPPPAEPEPGPGSRMSPRP